MICVRLASGNQSMFSLSLRKFFGFTQLPLLPKFNIGNLTPRLQGDRAAHTWSMHRKGAIILINRISNQEKTPPGGGRRGLNWLGRFWGHGERACQATLSSHDSNKRSSKKSGSVCWVTQLRARCKEAPASLRQGLLTPPQSAYTRSTSSANFFRA